MEDGALTWNFLAWNSNGNGEPIRCIEVGFGTACSKDDGGKNAEWDGTQAEGKRVKWDGCKWRRRVWTNERKRHHMKEWMRREKEGAKFRQADGEVLELKLELLSHCRSPSPYIQVTPETFSISSYLLLFIFFLYSFLLVPIDLTI